LGVFRGGLVQAQGAVVGDGDLITLALEHQPDELQGIDIVVDDQNLFGHRRGASRQAGAV
jgi:hypothetical protein